LHPQKSIEKSKALKKYINTVHKYAFPWSQAVEIINLTLEHPDDWNKYIELLKDKSNETYKWKFPDK